jgi:hypothetical protein
MLLGAMFVLQVITPWWWWIMVVPFVISIIRAGSGRYAFWIGFLSGGLLWFVTSTYQYLTGSQIIARRVASMVGLGSSLLLIILTALIAAIAGGLAASAGYELRQILPRITSKR